MSTTLPAREMMFDGCYVDEEHRTLYVRTARAWPLVDLWRGHWTKAGPTCRPYTCCDAYTRTPIPNSYPAIAIASANVQPTPTRCLKIVFSCALTDRKRTRLLLYATRLNINSCLQEICSSNNFYRGDEIVSDRSQSLIILGTDINSTTS